MTNVITLLVLSGLLLADTWLRLPPARRTFPGRAGRVRTDP